MAIGGHGNLLTALEVIGPNDATVTIHALPMGVGIAVVEAHRQAIATNVPIATVDVKTAVLIPSAHILVSATQATNVVQATGNDAIVSVKIT